MQSKKIYITLGVLIALSAAFFALVIIPIFNGVQTDAKDYLAYKEKYSLAESKIESLRVFNDLYKKYQDNLAMIDSLFVDEEVPVEFIKLLENTAQEFQLEIKVSSVTLEADKNNPEKFLNFQISINGHFSNFYKFLGRMENSSYLIGVSNMSIRKLTGNFAAGKDGENSSQNDVNAIFTLKVAAK